MTAFLTPASNVPLLNKCCAIMPIRREDYLTPLASALPTKSNNAPQIRNNIHTTPFAGRGSPRRRTKREGGKQKETRHGPPCPPGVVSSSRLTPIPRRLGS